MPIPSIRSILRDNWQLTRIGSLNLSAEDEVTYKASLAAEYRRAIADLHTSHIQPGMADVLQTELKFLLEAPTDKLVECVSPRGAA